MSKLPPPLETHEAYKLAQWLQIYKITFAHVPNELNRPDRGEKKSKRYWARYEKLKAEGWSAGVPDYLIFDRPPNCPEARGVAIELKRTNATVSDVSSAQKEWLEKLDACGWAGCVAKGADDAIAYLEELGFGRRHR